MTTIKRFPVSLCALLAGVIALMPSQGVAAGAGWTNVQDYFPDHWQEEDQLDLREYVQRALDENAKVYFPGSDDPDEPLAYHVSATLEVPEHTHVQAGPNHRIVRLPSEGRLFTLYDHARMTGLIIDGNKYAHWPEYESLGKEGEAGVHFRNHALIEDTVVFNNPGHAFSSRGDYNKLYRNRAENIGYIDVRYGARFYQTAWGSESADGFYLRGEGNLVKDSVAYDTFRWDFCSSHSGARQNTYVDCRGGDINLDSYGFIDIEEAEGNNRLIRCISPNSRIAVPVSQQTEVIQCMASHITVWDRAGSIERYEDYHEVANQGVLIAGNLFTEGGLAVGGYYSDADEVTPGAASPTIVNNRIYKTHPRPGHRTDWSFSVQSTDGHGVVANNLLFEYENEDGERGPGMQLDNIEGTNNQVIYGQWELDLPTPTMQYGYEEEGFVEKRISERGEERLREHLSQRGREGRISSIQWLDHQVPFIKDPDGRGGEQGWHEAVPDDDDRLMQINVTEHWDFALGYEYHGTGWYYLQIEANDFSGGEPFLFFAAIDSEADIYVDGEPVYEHSGWQDPVLFPAGDYLSEGERHLVTLAVRTGSNMGGMYGPAAIVVLED